MSIPEPKPHRRWGRYSLRTLLAVVTIVAIWLGIVADRAVRQRRAVAVVRRIRRRGVLQATARPVYQPSGQTPSRFRRGGCDAGSGTTSF